MDAVTTVVINNDYITLGQFLKLNHFISNGGQAKYFLEANSIRVNGLLERRRGKKLFSNFIIDINNKKYQIQIKKD
ncbi:MAG: RNA-binding S4 domain-containing protein [Mycoplasmataceae bacterium]|jgi:ribosome-associated protein YbcJ (S4-like RNA binding protein)|nr:RNA-binding S4 domain-containing protein [Mycoplasmataceae bacterium]